MVADAGMEGLGGKSRSKPEGREKLGLVGVGGLVSS
jgi:hypothetical protein